MGMRTTIYGYIEEMDFWKAPIGPQVRKHNSTVIKQLPKGDDWPPLSYEMFAICTNHKNSPGSNLEYSGRIIHFGANLKSVEHEWKEWRAKFEKLLTHLYFTEARVHFKTEYSSLETSSWKVDLLKYEVTHDNSMPRPIKINECEYESTYDS
jgi:hypothetical protein